MQQLVILQSLWSMERRHTDGFERSLEENVRMIKEAGFGGLSTHWRKEEDVRPVSELAQANGLVAEGQCFPKTVDDLKFTLELATKYPVKHVNVQPDVRPRRIEDSYPLIEGWMRLAEQVPFPVLIETHRDRLTTDLFFVLDLLERYPDLPLIADVSHFLVGREFAWPVDEENHAMIHRILRNSWAFHGRVASREQVQIEISFPHHKPWVDLFLDWWRYGFEDWRKRAGENDILAFTCELGPKPYAITGKDGNDTTDRWAESLQMKELVEDLWKSVRAAAN